MADKQTIGISSLILAGIVSLFAIVPGFFDEPKYFCQSTGELVNCIGGINENYCFLDEDRFEKQECETGWLLVQNDLATTTTTEYITTTTLSSIEKYSCSINGCEAI